MKNNKINYPYKPAKVKLEELFIDREQSEKVFLGLGATPSDIAEFQRGETLRARQMKKDGLHPDLLIPIVVNLRPDGTKSVLDGGTRVTNLVEWGFQPDTEVWVLLYQLSLYEEVELFVRLNTMAQKLSRNNIHNAAKFYNPDVKELDDILRGTKKYVSNNGKAPDGYVAVTNLKPWEVIYKRDTLDLKRVATLYEETGWQDLPRGLDASIVSAIGQVVATHKIRPGKLERIMSNLDPEALFRQARKETMVSGGGISIAKAAAYILAGKCNSQQRVDGPYYINLEEIDKKRGRRKIGK